MVSLGDLALPGVSVDADARWAHTASGMPSAEKGCPSAPALAAAALNETLPPGAARRLSRGHWRL